MSHLDARLNLARKSQILTRDLSLPIVPRLHPQEDERYCFIVEWLDPHSGLTMRYQMLYGPADCSVEMVRTRTRTPGDSFHSSPRQPKRLHSPSSPIRHESDHSAPSPIEYPPRPPPVRHQEPPSVPQEDQNPHRHHGHPTHGRRRHRLQPTAQDCRVRRLAHRSRVFTRKATDSVRRQARRRSPRG